MPETLTRINGNKQEYTIGLPKLYILTKNINDVALQNICDQTGLYFRPEWFGYTAQPHNSQQITQLLLSYNFKTRYYNNADWKNVLMLKFDHHVGFDVDSICLDCCKANHIHINGLKQGDRLAC